MPAPDFTTGRTTYFACQYDSRFSYCLYVPEAPAALCVYVHGTERDAAFYRDALADFAETRGCIVLAPLFPAGLIEPRDLDNYKNVRFHDIPFDHVLLAMVAEVAARYGVSDSRFLLGGFSGGAQFAHRFLYLHPHRVAALSVAAPGRVTLLDQSADGWLGVRDLEAQFGVALDLDALRRVPVHLAVGALDTDDVTIAPNSRYWMPGVEHLAPHRVGRLTQLYASYRAHGLDTRLEIVPDAAHEAAPLVASSAAFFAESLCQSIRMGEQQPTNPR